MFFLFFFFFISAGLLLQLQPCTVAVLVHLVRPWWANYVKLMGPGVWGSTVSCLIRSVESAGCLLGRQATVLLTVQPTKWQSGPGSPASLQVWTFEMNKSMCSIVKGTDVYQHCLILWGKPGWCGLALKNRIGYHSPHQAPRVLCPNTCTAGLQRPPVQQNAICLREWRNYHVTSHKGEHFRKLLVMLVTLFGSIWSVGLCNHSWVYSLVRIQSQEEHFCVF